MLARVDLEGIWDPARGRGRGRVGLRREGGSCRKLKCRGHKSKPTILETEEPVPLAGYMP